MSYSSFLHDRLSLADMLAPDACLRCVLQDLCQTPLSERRIGLSVFSLHYISLRFGGWFRSLDPCYGLVVMGELRSPRT